MSGQGKRRGRERSPRGVGRCRPRVDVRVGPNVRLLVLLFFFFFLINLQFSSSSHSLDDSLRNTTENEIRLPIHRLGAYSGSGGFRAALRRVPSWIRLLSQKKKVVRRWAFVSQPYVLDFGPLMNSQ
jgi:hypothetical protein